MSTAYMGEIKIVSFNFAPKGWALCNGQILPIVQNQALFSLLQTFYGGDGARTFGLPNFQGREPLHKNANQGSGQLYQMGELGGEATHKLTLSEMASHTHTPVQGSSAPPTVSPFTNSLWAMANANHYTKPDDPTKKVAMHPTAIAYTGSSQGHENMPPYLVLNFIICLMGVFPSRS